MTQQVLHVCIVRIHQRDIVGGGGKRRILQMIIAFQYQMKYNAGKLCKQQYLYSVFMYLSLSGRSCSWQIAFKIMADEIIELIACQHGSRKQQQWISYSLQV